MSFNDFLCDRVDIYQMKRNMSNRVNLDRMANEKEPAMTGVPCRIHEEKAIFMPDIILASGDVIQDAVGERYEVTDAKKTRTVSELHHRTYTVKRRGFNVK